MPRKEYPELRKKLVIVGDGACGKTSLLFTFSKNEFPEIHIPTVFDTDYVDMEIDGKFIQLDLWDTAGQEDYERLRPLAYPESDIILICYSIDNPDSLENVLEKWHPEIQHFLPNIPIILVATKKDLRDDEEIVSELKRRRQMPVRWEQGLEVAHRIGAIAYFECSAKLREGVKEIFDKAVRETLRSEKKPKKKFCKIL
ncbi:hypothetical protein B9Z55_012190 [Caenorhabditis nigoni]|uniref:Ras-like GTP-binding protein Rho1 n=1 Tax=Caenorhabditis nigoni TaxID=1611254 RepID=A0A2G5TW22_9PELO|nr:hypothetical protein B9Z55_012190 [Caenorhabditis nigoni]